MQEVYDTFPQYRYLNIKIHYTLMIVILLESEKSFNNLDFWYMQYTGKQSKVY